MTEPQPVKPRSASPKARKKREGQFHHGDLAEQLAIVAIAVVEKQGHAALSLKALAARLGVTDAAIYRHYANRDALLAEVVVRGFLDFIAVQKASQEGVADPFESLRVYGRTYVRYAHAHPGWFRLQFSRTATEGLRRLPGTMARLGPAEAARHELLRRWRPVLPADDDRVADLYRMVWGTVHGLASFVVERVFQLVQTDEERIAAADVAIDLMIESLRARRTAGGPRAA